MACNGGNEYPVAQSQQRTAKTWVSVESSALRLQTCQIGGGVDCWENLLLNGSLCLSTHQINQNQPPTEELDRPGQSSHTHASILIKSYCRRWGLSPPARCTRTHAHSCCLAWVLYTDPNKLACGQACLSLSQVNDVINGRVAARMGAGVLAFKHLSSWLGLGRPSWT